MLYLLVTNLREEGTAVKLRERRQPVNPALCRVREDHVTSSDLYARGRVLADSSCISHRGKLLVRQPPSNTRTPLTEGYEHHRYIA